MKNFLFCAIVVMCSLKLFSQSPQSAIQDNTLKSTSLNILSSDDYQYNQVSSSKGWVSRWYNYGETMQQYHGNVAPLYGNFLFPDSTILVNYTSGYGSPWIHKLGDVLDVTSTMFNDAVLHPNALTIDAATKYRLDSIHFHCMYDRNISNSNIVDTLLFEISVNDNLLPSYFAPGILSPNLSTDTVFMRRVPYAYQTNSLNLVNKKIYKVPLTTLTYADSLSNGIHIIKLATDSLPVVNPGKHVVVSVTFIPGYTWVANTDIIDNKNSMLFLSRKERDNFFPHYTKKDFNVSYIVPSDVRYNYAGSWNANYIPSFAYMGTTPTYNYEHHLIYYKISTPFNITYQTQNVSCNGGNNGQINLTISGGTTPYTFLWSNGATTQNLNNLTAGNYSVTIVDQASDTTMRLFTITQPTPLMATVTSSPASVCGASDGAIIVSGISGGTPSYSIVVLDADSVTQTMTDLPAGIYTVKVTDSHGCKLIKYTAINESGAPSYTVSHNNISCYGQTDGSLNITINNPTGTPTYLWSNGQSGASISNLSVGNYLLTITDNNCQIFESFSITQPQPIQANGTVINASGGQANGSIILQISGGTAPYTYSWSSGQQTQNIGNIAEGAYTVTITDNNQCTLISTFVVLSVGVFEINSKAQVVIYPNPATDVLNFSFEGIQNKYADVNIYSIQGQLLKSEKIFVEKNDVYSIEINNFTQGLYFIDVAVDGYKVRRKFIKN